ncbi:UNVERIFIED_CONTAM: hypothetical protein FKN15_044069 [Acipenser sinensis]
MAEFWTKEREDELVQMWSNNPCLYDCSVKAYSNRISKSNAATEIAKALGTTSAEVMKRITSLRTQFLRLIKAPASGSEGKKRTVHQDWVVKNLAFLTPHVRKRPSISNMDLPQIGADDEAENVQESGMEDEDDETGSQETEDNSSQEIEEASDRHTSVHTGSDDDDLSKVQFATPKPHQSTKTPLAVGQRDKKKGAKKKKTSDDNMLEIQVLKNMSDSLKTLQTKTNHADDGIDIFSHNVSRKLRMIADPRLQFLVQEEIDRVISNGLKQYWSTSGDVEKEVLLDQQVYCVPYQ